MPKPSPAVRRQLTTVLVLAVLLGFLGVTVWFMITAWNSVEGEMGIHQWIAMVLGIFFSCLVGFGLMGLMFFSRRRGYDEPPTFDK
jgi:TRAP-type C4-dicarboxylate transport system permease small subunit